MTLYQIWLTFWELVYGAIGSQIWILDRIIIGLAIATTFLIVVFFIRFLFLSFTGKLFRR